jgi:DNA polymerase elongation subunit (family B)
MEIAGERMKKSKVKPLNGPRVLVFDIETAPILAYVWGLWENNVGLNQIHSDWYVLSWAAKWLHDPNSKIMCQSQRYAEDIEDDREILQGIWELLDAADVVVTQNGKSFDQKKLNARFVIHGMMPPSSYKHIDTKILAKKHFKFTSNRLDYMTAALGTTHQKSKHSKFSGFDLWKECLLGNQDAWEEMLKYNKKDVLALQDLYRKLIPWDNSVNFNLYHPGTTNVCKCGSKEFKLQGFAYTQTGKFQRYRCKGCGCESRDRVNLLNDDKKESIKVGTVR